jgi:hypothetical protein
MQIEPSAPHEAAAVDQRIASAIAVGIELSDKDRGEIRAELDQAEQLGRAANRTAGCGSDSMNKGYAFPMGVGFTRMTQRASSAFKLPLMAAR